MAPNGRQSSETIMLPLDAQMMIGTEEVNAANGSKSKASGACTANDTNASSGKTLLSSHPSSLNMDFWADSIVEDLKDDTKRRSGNSPTTISEQSGGKERIAHAVSTQNLTDFCADSIVEQMKQEAAQRSEGLSKPESEQWTDNSDSHPESGRVDQDASSYWAKPSLHSEGMTAEQIEAKHEAIAHVEERARMMKRIESFVSNERPL